jgi:SAM-dependent methyltransferase
VDPDSDIVSHYEDRYDEDARLTRDGDGRLELVRTQIILDRHLPPVPAAILDVGGGPGAYAQWLVDRGYQVDLLDVVPKHIRQATERGLRAQLGDARALPEADGSFDAVLLLGPSITSRN